MPHDAYVLLPNGDAGAVRAWSGGRAVEVIDDRPYCRVEWDGFDAPVAWLRDVSRDLHTTSLWLVTQKQVDAFAFQRWDGGEMKRALAYGLTRERTWESVLGSPEPWEENLLFALRALERRLKVLQVIDLPADQRDKAVHELKRIWAERRIEVGATEPMVSTGFIGPGIARYYGLPGWP